MTKLSAIDLPEFGIYISMMLFIGLWAGRRRKVTASELFINNLSFRMLLFPYILGMVDVSINVYPVAGLVLIFTILFCCVVSVMTASTDELSPACEEVVWKFSMNTLPSFLFPHGYPATKGFHSGQ
jgi:hypothetical protein